MCWNSEKVAENLCKKMTQFSTVIFYDKIDIHRVLKYRIFCSQMSTTFETHFMYFYDTIENIKINLIFRNDTFGLIFVHCDV